MYQRAVMTHVLNLRLRESVTVRDKASHQLAGHQRSRPVYVVRENYVYLLA